jgi:uncharacterized protein (TIGR02001 family)
MNIRKPALVALALLSTGAAQAELSANLGFASDYYYRGIFQATSSANGGLDFESGGFFAGTWAADVDDGLEIDGYFGYAGEISEIGYSIGYTGYFYTGDFDDTYQEVNLGGSFGPLTLDVAVGEYENFDGPILDYTYYALTVEKNGFYGKYAGFSQDASGEYFEAGYGGTVADIDLGISLIFNDKDLSGIGESDEAIIFTIGKAFDIK